MIVERHTKEWYQLIDKVLDERKEELRKVFLKASVKRKAKNILTAKAKKKKKEGLFPSSISGSAVLLHRARIVLPFFASQVY